MSQPNLGFPSGKFLGTLGVILLIAIVGFVAIHIGFSTTFPLASLIISGVQPDAPMAAISVAVTVLFTVYPLLMSHDGLTSTLG